MSSATTWRMSTGGLEPVAATHRLIGAGILGAVCGGCTVGPTFVPPHAELSASFATAGQQGASQPSDDPVETKWWAQFNDPELDSLINRLVRANPDVQIVAERIAQARAQRGIIASEGLPHIDARANPVRTRESENGILTLVEPTPNAPLEFNDFRDMATASWEIDLFGKVRRAVEAANANTEALREARHAVILGSMADLAQTYMQHRGNAREQRALQRNMDASAERSRLMQDRFASGIATRADVAEAEAQAAAIAENMPSLRATAARLVNALALLLDQCLGRLKMSLLRRPLPC